MLNWFYKWLDNRIQNSRYSDDDEAVPINSVQSLRRSRGLASVRESDDLATEPIQFKMYKAAGGWAIEFRQYDSRNDRVDTSLYVVNSEEELGNHISRIITMEALKR
jgi:hypothetical protein